MITKQARMIFSAYRRDDFADADGFVLQVAMVLERYPDPVIREVSSPITGIQRRLKYPPSLAELVDECDHVAERLQKIADLSAYKLAPRSRVFQPVERNLKLPDGTMIFYDEYMRDQQRQANKWRRFTKAELEAIYRKHGVADENTGGTAELAASDDGTGYD